MSTPKPPVEAKMASQFQVTNPYHSQGLAAGGSALLDAINKGKIHLAKFILDAGESDVVNTRDFKGKTPLIRACYIKEEKTRDLCVNLLVSRGADVNKQDDAGRTVLSYACETRCNDIVRLLVKNNIDPDIPDNKGNTALIYSAMMGNDTAVAILVRSFRRLGLDVDHMNSEGLSALLIAAKNGFIECASILALEGRACISFRDKEHGYNAEDWARAHGCSTKQILTLSPSVALLQHKVSSARAREETALLTPGGVRHYQGRRSFQFPSKESSLLIEDMDELSLSGSGSGKLLQKRGSLPSVTSFAGSVVSSGRGSPSCTSRSSSALGFIHHRATNNTSKASTVGSRFSRHERYVNASTQTDIMQNVAFNTSPDRPKSADPCGVIPRYGMTVLAEFGQTGAHSYLEQPLLCVACHAELVELRSPGISSNSTTRTSTRTTSNIKVDFTPEDDVSDSASHCED